MRLVRLVALPVVLALACAGPSLASVHHVIAFKAGKVITVSGADLTPGVVVVRDGRIEAVGGADLDVPKDAAIVDASTQVLMPGFVEASSQRGLDRTYEVTADASFVRVSDALNPVSLEIEDARRNGITTLMVAPDDRAFLAGRCAIIHPVGRSVDGMMVRQDAALKISLLPGPGESRMGHVARLRQILADARRDLDKREGRPTGKRQPADASRAGIFQLLRDEIPALVYCPAAEDVTTAFRIGREMSFHVVPVLDPHAWRAIPLLRANAVTVVVPPVMDAWERLPDGTLRRIELPKLLADAGVPFALTTDPYELGAQHPWYQAALAVRMGVPRDVALESVTQRPARLLGFGPRKGVIACGADADLLLLSADPLDGNAWVEAAYVKGERVYVRATDEKLKRLLHHVDEPPLLESSSPSSAGEIPQDEKAEQRELTGDAPAEATPRERERSRRWPAGPRR